MLLLLCVTSLTTVVSFIRTATTLKWIELTVFSMKLNHCDGWTETCGHSCDNLVLAFLQHIWLLYHVPLCELLKHAVYAPCVIVGLCCAILLTFSIVNTARRHYIAAICILKMP